jgi:hypothetical protein
MEYSKAITKKLKDEIFIWDSTAYSGRGYWYILGTKGNFGRPASKSESKKLGKPPVAETEPVAPEVFDEAPETEEPKKTSKSDAYRQARRNGGTPLGEMIFRKVFEEGEGLGSAIKGTISEKIKSKISGLKEKFDPLNISKKIFGNKLTAILGRKFGADDEDIKYFTGYGRKNDSDKIGKVEDDSVEQALYSKVSAGTTTRVRTRDSIATILTKLYNLIKKNHDEEIKLQELARNEKKADKTKDFWNKELIEALTGKKDEEPNLHVKDFNKFKKDLVKKLKQIVEAIGGGLVLPDFPDRKSPGNIPEKEEKENKGSEKGKASKEAAKKAAQKALRDLSKEETEVLKKTFGAKMFAKFGARLLAVINPIALGIDAYTAFEYARESGLGEELSKNAGKDAQKAYRNLVTQIDPVKAGIKPEAAQTALESGSEHDIKALGGRIALEEIIKKNESKAIEINGTKDSKDLQTNSESSLSATPMLNQNVSQNASISPSAVPMPKTNTDVAMQSGTDSKQVIQQQLSSSVTTPKSNFVPEMLSNNLLSNEQTDYGALIANNSKNINIINQNSDGLFLEQVSGIRDAKDPTIINLEKQYARSGLV